MRCFIYLDLPNWRNLDALAAYHTLHILGAVGVCWLSSELTNPWSGAWIDRVLIR